MKAILRQTRISPKKANLVAALVRNKKATEAIDILAFTPKKTAPILKKLIESAIANAENNYKQNKDDLFIKEILVTEGPTYKRSIAISRGRSHPIRKRTSHLTVTLEVAKESEAAGGAPKKVKASVSKKEDSADAPKSEAKTESKKSSEPKSEPKEDKSKSTK